MMKKFLLILALVVVVFAGRMACTATEEADVSTEVTYEEQQQFTEYLCDYTEEEFMELKYECLADVYSEWDYYLEEGWSEDALNRTIEVIESIEYDHSIPEGFDVESVQRAFVDIFVDEGFLDEQYRGMDFYELEKLGILV